MASKKKSTTNGKTSNGHLKAAPPLTADEDGVVEDGAAAAAGPGDEEEEEDETLSVAGSAIPAPVGDGDGAAFMAMLAALERGVAKDILAGQAQTLVMELKKRAKMIRDEASGTLTITLSYTADHEGGCAVNYRSESKLPRRKGGTTCFQIGAGGILISQDYLQPSLPGTESPGAQRGKTYRTDGSGNVLS